MTLLSKELLLPPRQAHFVEAYCMGQNATKAAMATGYSIKTTHVQGSRMLRNVKILSKIEDRMQDHQRRCSITVDTLTAELEEASSISTHVGGGAVNAAISLKPTYGVSPSP